MPAPDPAIDTETANAARTSPEPDAAVYGAVGLVR